MTDPQTQRVSDQRLEADATYMHRNQIGTTQAVSLLAGYVGDLVAARAEIKALKEYIGGYREAAKESAQHFEAEIKTLKAQGPYRSAMLRCRDLAKSVHMARHTNPSDPFLIEEYVDDLCAVIKGEAMGASANPAPAPAASPQNPESE